MTGPSGDDLHARCADARQAAGADPARAIRMLSDVVDSLVRRSDMFWEVMATIMARAQGSESPVVPPPDFMEALTVPGQDGVVRLRLGGRDWVAAVDAGGISPAELVAAYPLLSGLVAAADGEDGETGPADGDHS